MAAHLNQFIKVQVTYMGQKLTKRFYYEHPEIHPLYPTGAVFIEKIYAPLLNKANVTQEHQNVEISENAVLINGLPWSD